MHYFYTDEAGISDQEPVTVVVAVGIKDTQRALTEIQIRGALSLVPPQFRSDFWFSARKLRRSEEYGGLKVWPTANRVELMRRMMVIPRQLGLPIIWSIARRDHSEPSDAEGLISRWQRQLIMSYFYCVTTADKFMRDHAGPDEMATIISEDIPKMKRSLLVTFQAAKLNPHMSARMAQEISQEGEFIGPNLIELEVKIERIIGDPAFRKKRTIPFLQIADACAWGLRQFFSQGDFGLEYARLILGDNFRSDVLLQRGLSFSHGLMAPDPIETEKRTKVYGAILERRESPARQQMLDIHMARGVILGSPYVKSYTLINAGALTGGPLKPRFAYAPRADLVAPAILRNLLYFDGIECPNNDLMPQELPEIALLVQQGIVTRRTVLLEKDKPVFMGIVPTMIGVNTYTYQQLDQLEPGRWSFSPINAELDFWPPPLVVNRQAIAIELCKGLPVLGATANVAEILEFKLKRSIELVQFRFCMLELFLDVIDSRDIVRTRTATLDRLDVAIADLAAALHTSKLPWTWASVVIPVLIEPAVVDTGASRKEPAQFEVAAGIANAQYKFASINVNSPVSRVGPLAHIYRDVAEMVSLPIKRSA